MDTSDMRRLCETLRYVHNLMILHYNSGTPIAFVLNDFLRRYIDMRKCCFYLADCFGLFYFPINEDYRHYIYKSQLHWRKCKDENEEFGEHSQRRLAFVEGAYPVFCIRTTGKSEYQKISGFGNCFYKKTLILVHGPYRYDEVESIELNQRESHFAIEKMFRDYANS